MPILADDPPDAIGLWTLAGELADVVGYPVELLDLRAASTVMQYQIITTGQRLWARNSQAALYESFILSAKTALDEARAGSCATGAQGRAPAPWLLLDGIALIRAIHQFPAPLP